MTDQTAYPYQDGDVIVLGPELFADQTGNVLCWRGENYVRQTETAVQRAAALYERWVKAGPPPLGTSVSRWWDARLVELRNAVISSDPRQRS